MSPASDRADSAAQVLRLALPSSAVFFLTTALGVLMIRFGSVLGADAVAAVNTGTRLYMIFLAFATGINAGTLALVANAWGAGNRAEANRLLTLSLKLCVALGIAVTLLTLVFAPALIRLFGLTGGAFDAALSYCRWLALCFTPVAIYLIAGSGLRAAGDGVTPLLFAVVINGLAGLLAWRWSTHPPFGLAPHVRYVAIGFGCGNLLGAALAVALWLRGRLILRRERDPDGLDRARLVALWQVGYPAALEQGLLQIGLIAFLWLVAKHGTAAFAAYGAGISLLSLAMVVGFGFSIACSVLVGQRIGAGDPAGARRVVYRTLRVALVVMTIPALLLAWYAQPVAFWLTGDAEITEHTVHVFYFFTLGIPMIGAEFCIGGALRGAGDTRFPLLVVLAGMFAVRFTLAALFQWMGLGVDWLYSTLVADFAVKVALLWWRLRGDAWMRQLPARPAR